MTSPLDNRNNLALEMLVACDRSLEIRPTSNGGLLWLCL